MGQRIVYELALQEAMMSGGGNTPSQVPDSDCLLQSGICLPQYMLQTLQMQSM